MNDEVQAAIDAALAGHTTINLEIYYWWCTALMIAIHAGFLAYEMGASRSKNALASVSYTHLTLPTTPYV